MELLVLLLAIRALSVVVAASGGAAAPTCTAGAESPTPLFGVNYEIHANALPMSMNFNGLTGYDDTAKNRIAKALRPQAYRWPGGTPSGFFDLGTGSFVLADSDCDCSKAETTRSCKYKGSVPFLKKGGYLGTADYCYRKWNVERFPRGTFNAASWARGFASTETAAGRVVVDLNMLTMAPNETVASARALRNQGVDAQYLELSNELYMLKGAKFSDGTKISGQTYLRRCLDIIPALRDIFPRAKIAVISNFGAYGGGGELWNNQLAKEGKKHGCFGHNPAGGKCPDALTVHDYCYNSPKSGANKASFVGLGQATLNTASKKSHLSKTLKSFGSDTKLWMTELGFSSKLSTLSPSACAPTLKALYVLGYFLGAACNANNIEMVLPIELFKATESSNAMFLTGGKNDVSAVRYNAYANVLSRFYAVAAASKTVRCLDCTSHCVTGAEFRGASGRIEYTLLNACTHEEHATVRVGTNTTARAFEFLGDGSSIESFAFGNRCNKDPLYECADDALNPNTSTITADSGGNLHVELPQLSAVFITVMDRTAKVNRGSTTQLQADNANQGGHGRHNSNKIARRKRSNRVLSASHK